MRPSGRALGAGVREEWGKARLEPFDSPDSVVWTERTVEDDITGPVDAELDHILLAPEPGRWVQTPPQ